VSGEVSQVTGSEQLFRRRVRSSALILRPGGTVALIRYRDEGAAMNMRRRLATLALTVVMTGGGLAFPGMAAAAPAGDTAPQAIGSFTQMVNEYSRKCVIPKGKSLNANAPIVQRTCENNATHRWIMTPLGNGYYWVINQGSGLCLDLAANSEEEVTYGTRVQQFHCSTAYTGEQWRKIDYFGTGIYLLQNRIKNLCMDVQFRSGSNDAPLQVIECKLYEIAQHFTDR
jgi:hypothetical protein